MKILIYGATGNIGQQVIKYLKCTNHQIVGFSYFKNATLAKTIKAKFFFSPVNSSNVNSYEELITKTNPDLIINAIIGFAGLEITLLAIKHKINLALANKESMVVAGYFINKLANQNHINIYPIDSEHTSLMHIIKNNGTNFKKLYITASGGPFYKLNQRQLKNITLQQAIDHPTWKMGNKISINSATLMNKCFEIVECYWYFNSKNICVLYHPTSIIHAIVQYKTKTLACSYKPSMIIPIEMVISNFKTHKNTIKSVNLSKEKQLRKIKMSKPIQWGFEIINKPRSSLPIILNAANEYFIEKFQNGQIKYCEIIKMINKCVNNMKIINVNSIKDIYRIDKQTRLLCYRML